MRVPKWGLVAIGVVPLVALFAILVWGISRGGSGNPGGLSVFDSSGEAGVVKAAPFNFTLPLFSGGSLTLDEMAGKIVMVDFWASWCVPCRQEASDLEKVWQRYAGQGVAFVGVDVWDKSGNALDFIDRFGLTYPIGPDPKGSIAIEYGVTGIPEKYFITPDGRIVRKLVGPMTVERLSGVLDQLIARARAEGTLPAPVSEPAGR